MKLCDYIFKRLEDLGIGNVFCIPGESVQDLYRSLQESNLKSVLLSHEPCAGYAADAYSRLKGLGAVLVSYGVGSLNLVNAVGQAYAESSPLIVLSGGPGIAERQKYPLLHHKVRTFQTSQKVFEEITALSIIIESPYNAANHLEKAFQTALRYKKPVYIEIPRDLTNCEIEVCLQAGHAEVCLQTEPIEVCLPSVRVHEFETTVNADTLKEALDEAIELIKKAQNPVILADVEVSRIKMQKELLELVEKTGLPVASTLLGKSVIAESHPQSLGTFFGKLSNERAEKYIQSSDLILAIGTILSDVNLGMFTFNIDRSKMIESRIEGLHIKHHQYPEVGLRNFLNGLIKRLDLPKRQINIPPLDNSFLLTQIPNTKISAAYIQLILNQFINRAESPSYRIVSDVGDCLFIGQELFVNRLSSFLSPAYYLSMGFAIPGGIGAQIADSSQRSLILVGDGAFQMTGMELISAHRLSLNPIVVLLNNGIYATLDRVEINSLPNSYDIGKYDYNELAEIWGGVGYKVKTTQDLQSALQAAEDKHKDKFVLIDIELSPDDTSSILNKFAEMMSKSNQAASGKR